MIPEGELAAMVADDGPGDGQFWRHLKGGGEYVVVARAFEEATMRQVVVYRRVGSTVMFTRPLDEFRVKFERQDRPR